MSIDTAKLREDAQHHREVASDCDCRPESTINWQHALNVDAAADEIDRLRAENWRLKVIADTDKASADHWRAECEKMRQGGEAVAVAWSKEQTDLLNFLLGASDIDGVWFGDRHPSHKGAFWWRENLRRLFASPPLQADACKVPQELVQAAQELKSAWSSHTGAEPSESRLGQAIDNAISVMLSAAPTREDK